MKMKYTIGELASFYGISKDTLRIYEEKGILKPERGENNYRVYSREDMLVLNYILKLKKMDYSLKEINTIINNSSILHLDASFRIQEKIISDKKKEIETLEEAVREYRRYIYEIIHNLNKIEIVNMPTIIFTFFNESVNEELKRFNILSQNSLPRFTFLADKESFMDSSFVDRMIDSEERERVFKYGMSIIDKEGLYRKEGFSEMGFEMIQGGRTVRAVIRCIRNEDYEMIRELQKFIRNNSLEIRNDICLQSGAIQRNNQTPEDYYEIWIPIE